MNIDGGKDLVTIKGTLDAKEIVPYLTEKLKRDVEVIQPKKEEDNKKNKEKDGGKEKKEEDGGEKKEGGKAKVEVNKMEHYGHGQQPPMYWYDGYEPGQSSSNRIEVQQGHNYNYANQGGYNYNYNYMNQNHHQQGYDYSYGNQGQGGYTVEPQQPPFYLHPNHPPPQMFSDENPNACSMM